MKKFNIFGYGSSDICHISKYNPEEGYCTIIELDIGVESIEDGVMRYGFFLTDFSGIKKIYQEKSSDSVQNIQHTMLLSPFKFEVLDKFIWDLDKKLSQLSEDEAIDFLQESFFYIE